MMPEIVAVALQRRSFDRPSAMLPSGTVNMVINLAFIPTESRQAGLFGASKKCHGCYFFGLVGDPVARYDQQTFENRL